MIIYKDLISDDEIISDAFKIIDAGNGLWEIDGKIIKKGAENFELAGANPSAEGEDADEGGDSGAGAETVLDIADQFQYEKFDGLSKKMYQTELKTYMKTLVTKMKEAGKSDDEIKAFQTEAPAAAKKILGNWDNYDVYRGASGMDGGGMYVLVDFREDGVTPFINVWKAGLKELKV